MRLHQALCGIVAVVMAVVAERRGAKGVAAREAAKSHPVPGPLLMAWVILCGVCSVGYVPGGHQECQTCLDRALVARSCW